MRLSDFLAGVGRPNTYYPRLAVAFKSLNAAVLLGALDYWRDRTRDEEGWIYKSVEEIQTETGLTYDEQRTGRSRLKAHAILEERNDRIHHRMYYRINYDALDSFWERYAESGKIQLPKLEKPNSGNGKLPHPDLGKAAPGANGNGSSLVQRSTAQSTTESTSSTGCADGGKEPSRKRDSALLLIANFPKFRFRVDALKYIDQRQSEWWEPLRVACRINFKMTTNDRVQELIEATEALTEAGAQLEHLPLWLQRFRERDFRGRRGDPPSPRLVYLSWNEYVQGEAEAATPEVVYLERRPWDD